MVFFLTQLEGWIEAWLGSQVGLNIDSGQCKDESGYYYNFKTRLGGHPRARFGSCIETVNSGQHKNKNCYYYSFRTRFGGRREAWPESWVV